MVISPVVSVPFMSLVRLPGSPSTDLYTTKDDFTDFIFTCEVKFDVLGNSGIQIRSEQATSRSPSPSVSPTVMPVTGAVSAGGRAGSGLDVAREYAA